MTVSVRVFVCETEKETDSTRKKMKGIEEGGIERERDRHREIDKEREREIEACERTKKGRECE